MSSYKILYSQLPEYFRPIIEFREILKAHAYALDEFESNMMQVAANHYIQTADAQTISCWENLLGITYMFGDTLEYRQARVLQKLNIVLPFSIGFLNDQLTKLYGQEGYELHVDPKECTLTVKITSDRYGAVDLLYSLLWDVVPAHIQIIANQETTNYIGGSRLCAAGFTTSTFIQTIGEQNNGSI